MASIMIIPETKPPSKMPQTPIDPNTLLLRACACLHMEPAQQDALAQLVTQIEDWRGLINSAERHALAPLVYHHFTRAKIEYPRATAMELRALTLRHRAADQIRSSVLLELLTELKKASIQFAVLKGAALAHIVYPKADLRPRRDLDVLVDPQRADEAQSILRDLGFNAPEQQTGYLTDHHHLPGATLQRDGLTVSIEIHHDALSGDVDTSIRTDRLTAPLRDFDLKGFTAQALGHVDMLRHLSHHTLEPVAEIKLGSVVDIFGYAEKFVDEIDWRFLTERYPFVITVMQCLHYLNPIPQAIHQHVSPPKAAPPSGAGMGILPLSQILRTRKPKLQKARELLYPSDWWLHAFYNVSPDHSLWWTRWVRHPVKIMRWLWRRFLASRHSRS